MFHSGKGGEEQPLCELESIDRPGENGAGRVTNSGSIARKQRMARTHRAGMARRHPLRCGPRERWRP